MRKKVIAITGPSGVGKTTLGELLIRRNQFVYPVHTTTRSPRLDDKKGFYNYITHSKFSESVEKQEFLFWSGDHEIVNKENGNFYGILNKDYDIVEIYDRIMMFISYKDIQNIFNLNENGYNIDIINLVYNDLEKNMVDRLLSTGRNHSADEIKSRIKCAKEYEKKFEKMIESFNILRIPTDIYDIEETYDLVRKRVLR